MRGSRPILLLLMAPVFCHAQGRNTPPPPQPLVTSPLAVQPGATTTLAFSNSPAGTPVALWTSIRSQSVPKLESKSTGFGITLPADAPVGIHAVRVATAAGLSNVGLVMVDDLPTVPRTTNNRTPVDAQSLTPPLAADGAVDPLSSRYYRFPAAKGQRLAVEVVAQRLGSRMDPMVRVLDAAGRELALVDDTPGLGADVRFAHTFAADGEYLLELRDANYEGSADHRYRLRVGDFPDVTVAFPLAAPRGKEAYFDFLSTGGDRLGPLAFTVSVDGPRVQLPTKLPGGRSSAFVPAHVADRDVVVVGPSSTGTPTTVTLPASITGHLASPGARHFFEFPGKKGDRVALRGKSRSLGSPADLFFQVTKPDGSKLAETRFVEPKPPTKGALPPPPDEGTLDVPLPSDGVYRLLVEDVTRSGGPTMVYHLDATRIAPDFSLSTEIDKIDTTPGGTFRVKVKADRQGYTGPITLSLTGPASVFSLKKNTIAAGKSETDLEVSAVALPGFPALSQFTVVGTGDGVPSRGASNSSTLRRLFPRTPFLPPELDGAIGLLVRPGADGAR